MGMVHVSAEELSALLDGELSPQAELRARQHLALCPSCSAEYALSVRLDDELRQPPVLACNEVLLVLSAALDREASEGEQAAAQHHLAGCQDCRASVETWSAFSAAIKALPVIAPSARIDDAIYAITRNRRTYRPAPVRGIAARALIAVTAAIAVIVASLGSGGGPAPIAVLPTPPGAAAGPVSVINTDTKQVETVRDINVALRLVVPDQQGGRSALVSADATQLVDGAYKLIATLPGGVSAAFSKRSDNVAVLSASGSDSVLTFSGFSAPDALKLTGIPRALTALPDGGYLVLVDLGGRGRVSKITRDGAIFASIEVASTGGDLIYDAATDRFTVANNGHLDTAQMPEQVATTQTAPPTQTSNPATSNSPSPSTAPATPEPSVQPVATIGPNVLSQAHVLTAGSYYNLPLNCIKPQFVAANGSRLWMLHQSNNVSSFDMNTGDIYDIGSLAAGAQVSYWVSGGSYVYGIDARTGEVSVVNTARERVQGRYATNVLSPVSAVAVGIDGRLWIAMRSASYLFVFDPMTQLMSGFDLGATRISALTIDGAGRIYYADDARGTVGTFDPRTSRLNEVPFT